MTLTKNKMVQEIGRRTRLANRDVKLMLETLIEVWKEELVKGGKIELEHFLVIEVQTIERNATKLISKQRFRRITIRASKTLRTQLNIVKENSV